MEKLRYFKCYSINVLNFLKTNEVYPLSKGINEKSGKTFWVFVVDERLSELLTIWTKTKPSK